MTRSRNFATHSQKAILQFGKTLCVTHTVARSRLVCAKKWEKKFLWLSSWSRLSMSLRAGSQYVANDCFYPCSIAGKSSTTRRRWTMTEHEIGPDEFFVDLESHLQKPVDPNLCWAFLSLFSPSTLDWSHKHGFTGICRCWLSHQPTTDLQSRRQEHEILTVWFEICVPFVSEFIEFWFRYNFWFHLLAIETNLTRGICLSAKKFLIHFANWKTHSKIKAK